MSVTILGAGAYGLALALMANKNTSNIIVWTKFEDEKRRLEVTGENKNVLKGVKVPSNIKFTTNLGEAIHDSQLIIIAVPIAALDSVCNSLSCLLKKDQHVCIATKGIEKESCLLVSEVFLKYNSTKNLGVISGPSFAIDIANMSPTILNMASLNGKTEKVICEVLENEVLKLKKLDDINGVMLCGAIKNVIAIAAGMLDGLGYKESTYAMFITEMLSELQYLVFELGGKKETVYSFAGLGDILLTSSSPKSRNFMFGKLIGMNTSKKDIKSFINTTTIEGLYTLEPLIKLLEKRKINVPIIKLIYNIIYNEENPKCLINYIMSK